MNIKIKALIIPVLIIYFLLTIIFSYAVANAILLIILGVFSFKLFSRKAKQEYFKNIGINSVPPGLRYNNQTLKNDFCIIRYFSYKKITVIENPKNSDKKIFKAFVIDQTNNENIRACWLDICSVYDEYTNVDSLFSYIDKSSGRLNIKFFDLTEKNAILNGMEEFIPKIQTHNTKKYEYQNKKFSESSENKQIIVNFDELDKQDIPRKEAGIKQDVYNMQDLSASDKIDVNLADTETISSLPGINIVMAKRIVEYRNLNGFFSNKEDFIKISEVKDNFKEKILNMITVKSYFSIPKQPKFSVEQERTVD
ncbi:helix-hairpin-helix domain-containing protein [bacterium]|nr:helix-hairpin-helix domain-containing protein [bacterium]